MNIRNIKSFVRRSNKLNDRFQKVWDQYSKEFIETIPYEVEEILIPKKDYIAKIEKNCIIEIGSGYGDSIVQSAKNNPENFYLGLEVYKPALAHTLMLIRDYGVKNIKLVEVDAKYFIQNCIEDNSIKEFRIYFPDPWRKKKHHKRRLVQEEFLKSIKPKLIKNGVIRIATDWEDYANDISQIEGIQVAKPYDRVTTKFERRAMEDGRKISDFIYP